MPPCEERLEPPWPHTHPVVEDLDADDDDDDVAAEDPEDVAAEDPEEEEQEAPSSPEAVPERRLPHCIQHALSCLCSNETYYAVMFCACCFLLFTDLSDKPAANPLSLKTLPLRPWNDWRKRRHDLGVPRIMMWAGRPSEQSTTPDVENSAKIFAAPNASRSGVEERITCPYERNGDFRNNYAPDASCVVTYDRGLVTESDAIVFPADSVDEQDLPRKRAESQLWVLWARTAPALHVLPVGSLSRGGPGRAPSSMSNNLLDLFNWSMASRDSHVKVSYNSFRPRSRSAERSPLTPEGVGSSDRSAMVMARADAVWITADCERHVYEETVRSWWHFRSDDGARDLPDGGAERAVSLQVIPNCGAGYCHSMADCIAYVARHFNFIVVTEAPACFQSLYELVYEAFKHDVVPVVVVPQGTELHLPPVSVVSTDQMRYHGQLGLRLRYLLDYPADYERHFDWKRHFIVTTVEHELCPLCINIHMSRRVELYAGEHVREWWHRRSKCGDSGATAIHA